MALKDITDSRSVLQALEEFDSLGREAFLSKYGFGKATGYFVRVGEKRYDSKAIAGAAHGFQHGTPMSRDDFRGGDATVAHRLESLGFEVTRPDQLPNWAVDELMLALHLYLSTSTTVGYGTGTKEVIALSEELRSLRIFPETIRSSPKFRNPSGVALKLANFASSRPPQQGIGNAARRGKRPRNVDGVGPSARRVGGCSRRDTNS